VTYVPQKKKGKVHSCTSTEALFMPVGWLSRNYSTMTAADNDTRE